MINDNIRKYRKEKGISQEEMAVRLHVVRQTVSKWENGKSVPDAEALIGISKLLEVPVSKLLGAEVEQTDMKI
uniref:helix-turn-helix domain-containing protein n=1 Tax=Mediterraneibacter glycyrrhizinilyticus TaxID=342942 RepID=UPI0009FB9296